MCVSVCVCVHSEYSSGNWLLHGEVVEPLDKTPLAVAVESGDIEAVKLFIQAGTYVCVCACV